MDIDLLSKMVKELILDNDKVVLPGFGAFVAEIVPSTFSDKGYTINPPYRKLYFRARPEDDNMLVRFYAESNQVDLAVADKVVRDFVTELKSVLFSRKTVVFPGLGRLRATKENAVFFVADEDMDIYPDGFGLEPISLKTHEETPQQIYSAVAQLKAIVEQPVEPQEISVEPQEISVEPQDIKEEPQEEPVAEEPVAEEPVAEEPVAEEPVAEEPVAEEPVAEEAENPNVDEVESEEAEEAEAQVEEPAVEEPVAQEVSESGPAKKKAGFGKVLLVSFICLVVLAVLLFAAFMAAAHWAPELLDTILYTPEELEILNY